MKKLFLFSVIFMINMIMAQNFNWDNALSQIYVPQSGFGPQEVLLDKAPMFADLYNFNYPEHNVSNNDHFRQALSELYSASSNNYFSNGSNLPDFENTIADAIEIPIGIISTKCAYLNYDEENNYNGNLKLQNGVFVPINSSVSNFIQKDLLVIAPLFPSFTSNNTTFTFKVDPQQMFQYGNIIQNLEADFGDGNWRNLIVNTVLQPAVSVNINTSGVQKQIINFRATFPNGVQTNTSASILLAQKTPDISSTSKSGVCGMSGLLKHRSEKLISEIQNSTNEYISSAEKLKSKTEEELNWKQNSETWSILECLEHLNLYAKFYLPEIENAIQKAKSERQEEFKSGFWGNYFAKSMLPKEKLNKMKTAKDKNPLNSKLDKNVIENFIAQQKEFNNLLERAKKR